MNAAIQELKELASQRVDNMLTDTEFLRQLIRLAHLQQDTAFVRWIAEQLTRDK